MNDDDFLFFLDRLILLLGVQITYMGDHQEENKEEEIQILILHLQVPV